MSSLLLVGACAVNPVTGERQLALVTEAQEIQMGREAAQQVEQTIGFVDEAALQAYVDRLGQRLAAASERPELPWTFRVVEDPTPNAFALPGGFIYLTRGMMNLMDSEAELATVLGHEIAHVTARHGVTALTRQQLASLGLGIGGILFPELQPFGRVFNVGVDLLFLKYGRGAEREADELGFRYALEQTYDVTEMADVFLSLQRFGELAERSALPNWLASHPAPEERIENVEALLAAIQTPAQRPILGREPYLERIDGLVYGVNPRNGFFREGVFYHPDLAFRLAVPQQWMGQNLARAVIAINQERNAALQLQLVADLPPEQALQRFGAQQGVQLGDVARRAINGLPAVVGLFQASTQQGPIQGYVGFLAYGGRTYQLLTYAAAPQFAQHARTFQQIIGSFAPLLDRAILQVQPQRLDVVRLDRSMTLVEFNRVYPSAVPLNELAILNQIASESVPLSAGTLVKRVLPGSGPVR